MDFKDSKGKTFVLDPNKVQHVMLVSSGKGRSRILEVEAERRGITVEELEALMAPTEEERAQIRMQDELIKARDAKRLRSICEAYWENTPPSSGEREFFHDLLTISEFTDHPSEEQQKAFLMMLPQHIVGQGIAWGFNDTDVRGQIYDFINENSAEIALAIKPK